MSRCVTSGTCKITPASRLPPLRLAIFVSPRAVRFPDPRYIHALESTSESPRSLALNQEVIDFVLHRPSKADLSLIDAEIDRALAIVPDAVAGEMAIATMKLHTKPKL